MYAHLMGPLGKLDKLILLIFRVSEESPDTYSVTSSYSCQSSAAISSMTITYALSTPILLLFTSFPRSKKFLESLKRIAQYFESAAMSSMTITYALSTHILLLFTSFPRSKKFLESFERIDQYFEASPSYLLTLHRSSPRKVTKSLPGLNRSTFRLLGLLVPLSVPCSRPSVAVSSSSAQAGTTKMLSTDKYLPPWSSSLSTLSAERSVSQAMYRIEPSNLLYETQRRFQTFGKAYLSGSRGP
jgi:hypothetical protein